MSDFDVVVCGGGLAGLTLARQLRREVPHASVALLERARRPLPDACHKVGESSVELGATYFAERLGLAAYLAERQLPKNGLRFFCGNTQGPLEDRPEIGPPEFPRAPSFQLDRGRLENDLRAMVEADGVHLVEGASVKDIALAKRGEGDHRIDFTHDGAARSLTARWVVDAAGRRRIIHRKLDLTRPSILSCSASWYRVAERVDVNDLVPASDRSWHGRDPDGNRWLSTVHFMGLGYWLWFIPLSSGYTSIGIVCENEHHDFSTFDTPQRALAWIEKHEPVAHARIKDLHMEDFLVLRDYSYATKQAFSFDRWSTVGEAAAFVDPLYSPGSDFIAMSNSYTTRMIKDDLAGTLTPEIVQELEAFYQAAFRAACEMLAGGGSTFPYGDVYGAKVWWDFYHYWCNPCQCFLQRFYEQDVAGLRESRALAERFFELNRTAQRILRAWAHGKTKPSDARAFIPCPLPLSVLSERHQDLLARRTIPEAHDAMRRDYETATELVREILFRASSDIGPERFEGLYGPELAISRERTMAEDLPRRERLDAIPRIARDMERAFGRIDRSRAAAASEATEAP
jgi:flavin-dependent dehydrogenase